MRRLFPLCLLLCLLLCGCELPTVLTMHNNPAPVAEPEPQEPDDVPAVEPVQEPETYTLAWAPTQQMHPYRCDSAVNAVLLPLQFEGLFALGSNFEAEPLLCERCTVSADGMTWTLVLRENVCFSNGVRMTAADVVYSLEQAMEAGDYTGRLRDVYSVVMGDAHTLTIQLRQPMGNLDVLLDIPIIANGSIDAPIGTGAYVLRSSGEAPYLQRNRHWWQGEPPVERVELYAVDTLGSVRAAFELDKIDLVVTDLNASGAAIFHSNYELWSQDTTLMQFLSFQPDSPIFSIESVRAAVTFEIDRQTMVTELLSGYAIGASLPAHPSSRCYDLSLAAAFDYDPGALSEAVADAGIPGRHGVLLVCADNTADVSAATRIAECLNAAGLNIELESVSRSSYNQRLREGDYDVAYCTVRMSPDFDLFAFFGGELTRYAVQGDEALALCGAALENIGNYYTLHRYVMEHGLLCPLWFKTRAVMSDRGTVRNLAPMPDNVFYGLNGLNVTQ